MKSFYILAFISCLGTGTAFASGHTCFNPDSIPAKNEDVKTIDGIVHALYDVISGEAGKERNWDRFRTLFLPQARMISTGMRADSMIRMRSLSPEEYILAAGPNLVKNGFFENEIHRITEQYGHIVHLFSTYESKNKVTDTKPFARGINSIQLFNDGARWWIVNIMWNSESPIEPLPLKYLK